MSETQTDITEPYVNQPLDRDFYWDRERREWVYRWRDTRMVLVDSDELAALRVAREAIREAVNWLEHPPSRDLFGMRRGWARDRLRAALSPSTSGDER